MSLLVATSAPPVDPRGALLRWLWARNQRRFTACLSLFQWNEALYAPRLERHDPSWVDFLLMTRWFPWPTGRAPRELFRDSGRLNRFRLWKMKARRLERRMLHGELRSFLLGELFRWNQEVRNAG